MKTIRHKLLEYFSFILIFIFFAVLGVKLLNDNVVEKYSDTISIYDKVNSFYNKMDLANSSAKSYMYAKNDEDKETYHNKIDEVYDILNYFIDSKESYSWRFKLLSNMVDSYTKDMKKLMNRSDLDNDTFNVLYSKTSNEYELINDTSADYYQVVTEYEILNKKNADSTNQTLSIAMFFMSIFIFISLTLFMYIINNLVSKPLERIVSNINKIKENDFTFYKVKDSSLEMEILENAVNDMAMQIQTNIEIEKSKNELEKKLLLIENENLKKDELLISNELRILQNQVDPHFLFNTLNMIYRSANQENASKTSEMMEKVCDLYRDMLLEQKSASDLLSELKTLDNYLYIQRMRIGSRIDFNLEISDHLRNIYFPTGIFQLLIENAIMHGLKEVSEEGEIDIKIYEKDECIYIAVSDNGCGMDTDQLENLLISYYENRKSEKYHGLYIVQRRLKMFYGNNARISFNTMIDCGFEAIIEIRITGECLL